MTSPGAVRGIAVDSATDAVSACSAPKSGTTGRHAVAALQSAVSGTGAAVYAETTSTGGAAVVARGPGTLLDLQDRAGRTILSVGQSGFTPSSLAVTGALTAGSVAATGAVTAASVAATGAVTGASAALTGAVTAASVASTGALSGTTIAGTGDLTVTAGDLIANTAGKGLKVKEGSNARMGTGVLNGATEVVIATTVVTANSRILYSFQEVGGTPLGIIFTSARTPGVSFGVKGAATDTSVFAWLIVEPA